MTDNEKKITPRQERAVVALVQQPTIREAAELLKVNEVTVYRWLRDRNFQAAYRRARLEAVRQATARLQQACGQAVQTLVDVQADFCSSSSARVRAAKAILDLAYKAVEIEDLDERLRALEETADEWTQSGD